MQEHAYLCAALRRPSYLIVITGELSPEVSTILYYMRNSNTPAVEPIFIHP